MSGANLDSGALVAVDELVKQERLGDVADRDAVAGRDCRAAVEDAVAVAVQNDAVAAGVADGDGVNVDLGGGFGVDAGEVSEVSFKNAACDGDLALDRR